MICVSIGRGRHKHLMAEHRHLVDQGAELVELRLDYISGDVQLRRLLADRPCPVVVTCRRERDGGKWSGSEHDRIMLLRTAIAEQAEYVDLEEDVAADIPRFGTTRRIVSLHDFRQTPDDLPAVAERLAALDADVVKIATMANAPRDNLRMMQAIAGCSKPMVGLCMGEIGTPTRILAGRFGAPFTYATFHHERALAPGQLSFRQMTDVYRYDDVNDETTVYGVIADPIGHSLSPLIHNAAFAHLGINAVYLPIRVPREDLDDFFEDCPGLGIRGLSVTIPHKEAVLSKLTKVDGAVRGIHAANTIVFDGDDTIGYNTDYRASMDSVDSLFDTKEPHPLRGKTALVLGAGGVCKTLVFGLVRRGAEVLIASRTKARAQELANLFGAKAINWDDRHEVAPHLLVNGTPVGMHPNVDETPFEKLALRASTVVFDTVYNPEQTLLIKQARERGCRVISGASMFVWQAALQFRHFTGQDAPTEVMRDVLRRSIGAVKVS